MQIVSYIRPIYQTPCVQTERLTDEVRKRDIETRL